MWKFSQSWIWPHDLYCLFNLAASMIVKYLSNLLNLDSLYPKLHFTVGGWEGGRITVWTRFYWVHWEPPIGCLSWGMRPGEQLQSGDELWPWRPEERQERSGEGKTCLYRRAKALGISPKMYATGQEAQKRKARAKLGTGLRCPGRRRERLPRRRTLPAPLTFPSCSLSPCRRTPCISSARDTAQNPGAKPQNCENVSPAARLRNRVLPPQLAGQPPASREGAEGPAGHGGHWTPPGIPCLAVKPHAAPDVKAAVILDSLMTGLKAASVRNYIQITFNSGGPANKMSTICKFPLWDT